MDPNTSPSVSSLQPAQPQPQSQNNVQQTSASQGVTSPQPVVQQPSAAQQPPITGQSVDDKIFSGLRYWLILLGVSAFGEICGSFASLRPAVVAIWASGIILSYKAISKMKAANIDELKQSDKDLMVFYMAVDTIIAQLFYYFRLKKSLPKTAKLAFNIGWKVLILQLIFVVTAGVVLGSIFH
jgi:hypothetical protein